MMKKLTKLSTLLACTSLLFTACAGNAGSTDAGSKPEAATETKVSESVTNGETTNIEWFLTVGVVPSNWDQSQYVMQKITEKTGVTVSATIPADDADTKLNLMIANGNLPDIITLSNETLIKDLIDADLVWDMQEFFETYLPESKLINNGFPEDIKQSLISRDGGWYSIPSHILSKDNREIWGLNPATEDLWLASDYRENRGVIFNKTIMDELGITEDDVKTESGVLAAFEKVKQANLEVDGGSVYPLLANGSSYQGNNWKSDSGAVGTLAMMFGSMPVDEDGNYQSQYYNEQFKHAVTFLNTCAQNGYIKANDFTMDDAANEAACRSGRVFCFIGNTANTGFAYEGEWYTPGAILSDGGEAPTLGRSSTVGRGWLQNFISKETTNPEAVARFLDFMTSEEGLILWGYGDPEVDYTVSADGLITRTEAGTEKSNNASVTGVGSFWAFANQNFDQKFMDPSNDGGIIPQSAYGSHEKTYKYDSAAIDSLPGGYIEGNSEMLNISTEVKSYAQTELVSIILNATDSDFDSRYNSMLEQLNKLGLPTLDGYVNDAVQQNYKDMGYTLAAIH